MFPVHPTPNRFLRHPFGALLWLLVSLTASASIPRPQTAAPTPSAFLRTVARAAPARRVILILNYFDTCQAVTRNPAYAFRMLQAIHTIGQRTGDEQLIRYGRFVKDTFAKHSNRSNAEKAALFLAVGQQAEQDDDAPIAAVCRHFAGQYYFLNEDYGKAFEHLLAANRAFGELGYGRIPELSRYLYELAFNYYHFGEYEKTIRLLTESARYPAYNDNLAIQTYNTLGLVYARNSPDHSPAHARSAERSYRQAQQLAAFYHDSLWVGIIAGNLAELYLNRRQWSAALRAYQMDYRLGLKFGGNRCFPHNTSVSIADVWWQLGRLDSCSYYLRQSRQLYRRNRMVTDFARGLDDEYYLKRFYNVSRKYYRSVSDLPLAYRYADSLLVISERINKRYHSRQLLLAEQKLLLMKHQSEIEALEREKTSGRILLWISGVVLALVSLVFFLRWRFVRIKRRQDQVINAEMEKSLRLEKWIIEHELQRAKADLDVFVANLHEKNVLIDTITAELENLSQLQRKSHNQQQIAEAQQNLLDSSLLTNDDWDEFRRRFERVHPHFLRQLRSQFTDISPAEERLLALSKLGVNTRQMSRMLGISPESIRKTKYRMRKRLGAGGASYLVELLADNHYETIF